MSDTVLLLLCAIALAQFGDITAGQNGRSCDNNSSEAQKICMSENNENVLVVHRYCNMFYKCSNGKPYPYKCPSILLYDPIKEICEWPHLVECGERAHSDSDNGGSEEDDCTYDNDDESDNIEDNDSGNNNPGGACNCDPSEAPSICAAESSNGILVAHENCNQFYMCSHGIPISLICPGELLYNPYTKQCDHAKNVNCDDRQIPDRYEDNNESIQNSDEDNSIIGGGNCDPSQAPSICAAYGSDGVLVAHENCNQFYKCFNGKPEALQCPYNLLFNPHLDQCDWPYNVDCGDRIIPEPDSNDNPGNENDNEVDDNLSNDSDGDIDDNLVNDDENGGTCNCNPGEAPNICAGTNSDGVLIAHENCNQFYKCDHGKPAVFTCPPNTHYNPYIEQCDWTSNVACGDRVIPDPNDSNGSGGADNENTESDDDNSSNENTGTCNCNPGEAPNICAGTNSDGVLIAHENCNQFYKCDHGKPAVFTCPPNTHYNPYIEQCDWTSNVACGDRVIPDPNDSNGSGGADNENTESDDDNSSNENTGTCNCNPGEAPTICSGIGSDGILVAHENCNQFYKCDHGKPVVVPCPPYTFYNPYKEQCDWASNVECGDRVVPDPDSDDNPGNENDNEVDDNLSNDSNGDIDDNLVNDDENGGTCNCNPGEAPNICAGTNTDGVLIAHENCNQFYKCDHGKPAVFTCPPNTHYNPYIEQCDWASNVECGERVIPDSNNNDGGENEDNDTEDNNSNSDNNTGNESNEIGNENDSNGIGVDSESIDDCDENTNNDNTATCNCNPEEASSICSAEGSNGILIAHKICNQFYQCSYSNPVEFTCPGDLMYDPLKEECNWATEVDCADRLIPEPKDEDDLSNDNDETSVNDPDDTGSCNCNPGEAPSICLSDNSDGVLIAHEKCNQFYMCSNGLPIEMKCPGKTSYNPYQQRCDWASEVQCGDRLIQDSEESDDNDGSDENESVDDSDNTVHDDPTQADAICAGVGSDGTLVAHENCNQFYQCSGGSPIALNCTNDLMYNPAVQQCDWPRNVDCGDRIIPETDEECACNPRNAPKLCAKKNSDGKLIAHENCNQFYVCNHGLPVTRYCPSTLVYNIDKEVCDWPANVNCHNRNVISYSSINKHYESRQIVRI